MFYHLKPYASFEICVDYLSLDKKSLKIEAFVSANSARFVFSICCLYLSNSILFSTPLSHTHSLPSIIPSTKASGADGSATISAAVEGIMEGKEWVWDNGVLKSMEVEKYKQEIENTKRAELAEAKASIFNDFLSKLK